MATSRTILAALLLASCDKSSEIEPCADLVEFGCEIVECVEVDGTLRCSFELFADPGNAIDIALQVPHGGGDLDWNAWPWDADAGAQRACPRTTAFTRVAR